MVVDFSYSSYDHPQLQEQEQEQKEEEDDYIDMEVSSYYYNFLKSSPIHQPNEFEFMTQSGPLDQAHLSTTSPADELFYKGKLLPLHLPPRLQIMESLLLHHHYHTPLSTNAANTPASGTPFLSCNASPVESCHVSRELNPDEYFLECSNGSKKSGWSRKLKLIKHIRASKAYLKYLFGKSSTTDESSFMAAKGKDEKGSNSKRSTFGETKVAKTKIDATVCHRRSFSGAFKLLTSSSSSGSCSSSSSNSNASSDAQLFNRSSSANSEPESAVAGAIAHCKQSQTQVVRSRKTLSEIGLAVQFQV